jgi:hypothetical protein
MQSKHPDGNGLYPIMSFTDGDALVGRGAYRRAIGMFVVTLPRLMPPRSVPCLIKRESCRPLSRRRFPGVTDNAKARACARTIAGWVPRPEQPRPVTRLRPCKDS